MNHHIKTTICLIIANILTLACGGGGGGGASTSSTNKDGILQWNITDAKQIFVAKPQGALSKARSKQGLARNKAGDIETIFKLTDTGAILEVTYDLGTGVIFNSSEIPVSIYPVGQYTIFNFGSDNTNIQYSYLVKNATGEAKSIQISRKSNIDFEDLPRIVDDFFMNINPFNVDLSGRIYYPARGPFISISENSSAQSPTYIARLTIDDKFNISKEILSDPKHTVFFYKVDPLGNIIYFGTEPGNGNTKYNKAILQNKQIIDRPGGENFWLAPNNHIHYIGKSINGSGNINDINEIEFKADGTINTKYFANSEPTYPVSVQSFEIKTKGKQILVNPFTKRIIEVYNTKSELINISTDFGTINYASASENKYWISGNEIFTNNNLLLEVNPENNSTKKITSASGYSIYGIASEKNSDNLRCSATKSNGRNIIIKVENENIEEIPASETTDKITNITTIN